MNKENWVCVKPKETNRLKDSALQDSSEESPPLPDAARKDTAIAKKSPGSKNVIISRVIELLVVFLVIYASFGAPPVYSRFSMLIFYLILLFFSYIFGEFASNNHPQLGLNLRVQVAFFASLGFYFLLSAIFNLSSLSFRFAAYCWVYVTFLAPILGLIVRRIFPVPTLLVTDQKKDFSILKWWGYDCQETINKELLIGWLAAASDKLGRIGAYPMVLVDITNPNFGEQVVKFSENYFTDFIGIKSFGLGSYLLDNHYRSLNHYHLSSINFRLKRLLDIILSLLVFLVCLPVFLLIVVCIKIDSPGPVFYKHKRLGRNMTNFFLLKFRTMHQDADKRLKTILAKNPEYKKEFEATFKLKNDPRITRVGRFLRPYSLDEFPQIFNILRGEMSWVGPRPIVVEEVPYYRDYSILRFWVMPGATGLNQISGRCDNQHLKRAELDTHYAKTWSFLNDVKILFKTIPAVLSKRGAY